MADSGKCFCGKRLTAEDVCPLPAGKPCTGQFCPMHDWKSCKVEKAWDLDDLDDIEDLM